MMESNRDPYDISYKDVGLVQQLIERCLQVYMKPKEIVYTLLHQAKIEIAMSEIIFQRMQRENQEFFETYNKMVIMKEQIIRFNHLLEKHAKLLGRVNQNEVVRTTLAGSQTHSMNNGSAYQHQAPRVMSQIQMRQNGVVHNTLALVNVSQTHPMNNYSTYQHQAPGVMSQTQISRNGVVHNTLANGSQTYSMNNHSTYQHQTTDVMNRTQMSQKEVGPTNVARGPQTYSMNNYPAYQHHTPAVVSQTQTNQNAVVPTTLSNGLQTHSLNYYPAYQHQTPEVLRQTQTSPNTVVPNIVTNGSQTHSMSNFSAHQNQTSLVPFVASEKIQRMTNGTPNYYANGASLQQASMQDAAGMQGDIGMVDVQANMSLARGSNAGGIMNGLNGVDSQAMLGADIGLLEPYNEVIGEASVSPYNGGKSTSLTFNEALSTLETSTFGHSGQMPRSFSFSDCPDKSNNYSLSPFLGNDGNFIVPHEDINGSATALNDLSHEGFGNEGFGSDGFPSSKRYKGSSSRWFN